MIERHYLTLLNINCRLKWKNHPSVHLLKPFFVKNLQKFFHFCGKPVLSQQCFVILSFSKQHFILHMILFQVVVKDSVKNDNQGEKFFVGFKG